MKAEATLILSSKYVLFVCTGTEDFYGAMDFKVGGTRDSVTALQLDVKEPIDPAVLEAALKLAGAGRNVVLDEIEKQLVNGLAPRAKPKVTAPAVEVIKFDASRKRDLIGPGGTSIERFTLRIVILRAGLISTFDSCRRRFHGQELFCGSSKKDTLSP